MDAANVVGGTDQPAEDAVQQARRWLSERGLVVPDEEAPVRVPRASVQPAPSAPSDFSVTSPGHDALGGDVLDRAARDRDAPDADALSRDALEPSRGHGAGTRSALGFGTSGSEDRPRRRRAGDEPPPSLDPDADPESVARTIVLRKLTAQARTRAELEKALKLKGVPDDAARAVLDRMEAVGLVDDQGFARDWVESRQQRRYLSKGALRRELSAKGVDQDEIESALSTVEREDELEAARQLAAKKVKSMGALERPVRYRRLVGALGRRGFSSAIVGRVVSETLDLSET